MRILLLYTRWQVASGKDQTGKLLGLDSKESGSENMKKLGHNFYGGENQCWDDEPSWRNE